MRRQDLHDLLQDYRAGRLSAADAAQVQNCLDADPDLARFAGFTDWLEPRLTRLAEADADPHPSGQDLVTAALGTIAELPSAGSDDVLAHISQCDDCRELVTIIREADQVSGGASAPRPAHMSAWQRVALAAVLALAVFGASTYFGWHPQTPRPEPVRLTALTRSADSTTEITALASHHLPPLLLAFDPWIGRPNADSFTLQIRLLATDQPDANWPQLSVDAANWQADTGGLIVVWEQENLPYGHYRIEVRDDRDRVVFQAVFQLLPPAG